MTDTAVGHDDIEQEYERETVLVEVSALQPGDTVAGKQVRSVQVTRTGAVVVDYVDWTGFRYPPGCVVVASR